VDAWAQIGRIWLVWLVPGDPLTSLGRWPLVEDPGPGTSPVMRASMRHAVPPPQKLLGVPVGVVVAW